MPTLKLRQTGRWAIPEDAGYIMHCRYCEATDRLYVLATTMFDAEGRYVGGGYELLVYTYKGVLARRVPIEFPIPDEIASYDPIPMTGYGFGSRPVGGFAISPDGAQLAMAVRLRYEDPYIASSNVVAWYDTGSGSQVGVLDVTTNTTLGEDWSQVLNPRGVVLLADGSAIVSYANDNVDYYGVPDRDGVIIRATMADGVVTRNDADTHNLVDGLDVFTGEQSVPVTGQMMPTLEESYSQRAADTLRRTTAAKLGIDPFYLLDLSTISGAHPVLIGAMVDYTLNEDTGYRYVTSTRLAAWTQELPSATGATLGGQSALDFTSSWTIYGFPRTPGFFRWEGPNYVTSCAGATNRRLLFWAGSREIIAYRYLDGFIPPISGGGVRIHTIFDRTTGLHHAVWTDTDNRVRYGQRRPADSALSNVVTVAAGGYEPCISRAYDGTLRIDYRNEEDADVMATSRNAGRAWE